MKINAENMVWSLVGTLVAADSMVKGSVDRSEKSRIVVFGERGGILLYLWYTCHFFSTHRVPLVYNSKISKHAKYCVLGYSL